MKRSEEEFRTYALEGNLWSVIFTTGFPLAVYALLSSVFNLLDTLIASSVGTLEVSAVAYIAQIQEIVFAVGYGLVSGSMVLITRAYGAGDAELVRKREGQLVAMLLLCSLGLAAAIPFAPAILRAVGTPASFITVGSRYFQVILAATIFRIFNTFYLSIEKSRGNSTRIMVLNFVTVAVKLSLSVFFVFFLRAGIVMVAVATLIAYGLLFLIGLIFLRGRDSLFSINPRYFPLSRDIAVPLLGISYPLMIEKGSFSLGKLVVNGMVASYGDTTVGALGISNKTSGMVADFQGGFRDCATVVISQNLGAGKTERARKAWAVTAAEMLAFSAVGAALLLLFSDELVTLFSTSRHGTDASFAAVVMSIYKWDLWGVVFLALNGANVAYILGSGRTKTELLIAIFRIFIFRIPLLRFLQQRTSLGTDGVGVMMLVSNALTTLLSTAIVLALMKKQTEREKAEGKTSWLPC